MRKIMKLSAKKQEKIEEKEIVTSSFNTIFHQVENYLNQKYDLRLNLMKCEIECSLKGESDFKPVNENSIYVDLRKIPVKISLNDLKSILKSDFTSKFNPIAEYFMKLKTYEPNTEPDYIQLLGNHIGAEDQIEFNLHYRKWLVRAVRCALDDTYYNKQAFILVHDKQDSGKSTFCRFHCPPHLSDYIAEEISTDKDGLILLAKNFLINLDELSTLHKSEINSLKSYFSKDRINVRLPYDSKNSIITRKCSFIGSTNKGQFLQDETGSVRWLCFKINSINWKYSTEINIDDVWRQALYLLYLGTFKYDMTIEEIANNEERNREFKRVTIEMELIAKYFEKPETETDLKAEFITPTDIKKYIESNSGMKVSLEYLGRALTDMKFERIKKMSKEKGFQVYGYMVVKADLTEFYNN